MDGCQTGFRWTLAGSVPRDVVDKAIPFTVSRRSARTGSWGWGYAGSVDQPLAQKLGYQGITLDRQAQRTTTDVIVSLDDLLPIIEARRTTGVGR